MIKVQVLLQTSESEKRQIETKMDTQERFWVQKVKGLEESYRGMMDKLQSSEKDVKLAEKNLTILNEENKRVGLLILFVSLSDLIAKRLSERANLGLAICKKLTGFKSRRTCEHYEKQR